MRYILLLVCLAPTAFAQEVFMTLGANGEIVFSDQPTSDAERFSLDSAAVSGSEIALTVDRHEEIARMADELENARLARTPARAPAQPIPVVEAPRAERNYFPLAPFNRERFNRDRRGPVSQGAGPTPERRPFQPVFQPRSPALAQ